MADPFQDLFSQNVVRTPDGRYFLPLSKSNVGGSQMITPGGNEAGGTYRDNGDDTRTWIPDDNRPYYGIGDDKYYSLEDYYHALDPNSAGVGIIGSGRQNALSFAGAQRGNYNGELGYYVDPNSASGSHPATTMGQKGTESGLTQFLLSSALMGLGAGVGGEAGSMGSSAFEGSVPAASGAAGAGLETVGGSAGVDSLSGGAAADTVAPTGAEAGSAATQAPVAASGSSAGLSSTTTGLTAAEIAQLTPAALAVYNAFTGSNGGGSSGSAGNSTANNAAGTAAQISNDQWNYYKTNYQPIESNLIGQAQAAGSPEEFARARGVANADVTGAFDTARKNTLNRMQSYGINPGSPAFQSAAASTDIAEGATKAGALTAADNNTRNLAYSKALDVVGLGKGIPAQSAASAANAANAATAASKEKFAQNTSNLQNAGYGLNTVSNVAQKWFGSPSASPSANYTGSTIASPTNYGDTYSTLDPAYGASGGKVMPRSIGYAEGGAVIDAERTGPGAYDATALKGVLQKRGLSDAISHAESSKAAMRHKGAITPHMRRFAAGGGVGSQGLEGPDASDMGEIQGPGTETSDCVPAQIDGQQPAALSSGEFVMNAEVPKLSGEEIMQAINDAGLKKRQQHGLESQAAQVPPDAGMPTYRRGGPVMRYGLGA